MYPSFHFRRSCSPCRSTPDWHESNVTFHVLGQDQIMSLVEYLCTCLHKVDGNSHPAPSVCKWGYCHMQLLSPPFVRRCSYISWQRPSYFTLLLWNTHNTHSLTLLRLRTNYLVAFVMALPKDSPIQGRYKLYKAGTAKLVQWLATTANSCCDISSILSSFRKGGAHKQSSFHRSVRISTRDLIGLANAIVKARPVVEVA